jgi:hypothetical protein
MHALRENLMTVPSRKRRVVVVVPDLIFATRIVETAKQLGVEVLTSTRERAAFECRFAPTDLLVLDLEATPDLAGLKRELDADPENPRVSTIGFYPHVRAELRTTALAAGIDRVLPRSAFTARLGPLLLGEVDPSR